MRSQIEYAKNVIKQMGVHRPKVKPAFMRLKVWKASRCSRSPSKAHYFMPRLKRILGKPGHFKVGRLRCVFCHKQHSKVHPDRNKFNPLNRAQILKGGEA